VHHPAGDRIGAPQQALGPREVAVGERLAHARARDAGGAFLHRRQQLHLVAVAAAGRGEAGGVARSPGAVAEVLAHQDPARAVGRAQAPLEVAGLDRRETGIEALQEHLLHAQLGEGAEPLAHGSQACRRRPGREELARQRLEGEDSALEVARARLGGQAPQKRRVADVHAVEAADGERGAGGGRSGMAHDAHDHGQGPRSDA
jgi:hypothetical protein